MRQETPEVGQPFAALQGLETSSKRSVEDVDTAPASSNNTFADFGRRDALIINLRTRTASLVQIMQLAPRSELNTLLNRAERSQRGLGSPKTQIPK